MAHLHDDDEQRNDKFDMDADYEGGQWIGDEFFHRGKKQKRQQTKEEQLYGIFADDSDDERDGRRRGGLGGDRKRADYSKPVGFVAGGVVQHGPQDGDQQQQPGAEGPQPQPQPQQGAAAGLGFAPAAGGGGVGAGSFAPAAGGAGLGAGGGLGFSAAGGGGGSAGGLGFSAAGGGGAGGLGFSGGSSGGGHGGIGFSSGGGSGGGGGGGGGGIGFTRGHATLAQEEREEEEEEAPLLPSAFGRRIQAAAEQRKQAAAAAQRAERAKTKAAQGPKGDVGKFEAHTKGIGAKLLSKMGWQEGQGLGRDRKGIAKPLEAKLRPKGMGMGFGDYTEHKLVAEEDKAKEEAKAKAKEDEVVDVRREAKMWKKKNADHRTRRTFKTADEVLKETEQKPAAAVERQTIIDMRGPQARVVTNLEHLNVEEERGDGAAVPMPELQHNMRLLVDLAEADIQRLDAHIRHEKDTAVILGKEQERLEEEAAAAGAAAQRMERVMAAVGRAAAEPLSLGEVEGVYRELRGAYREEYVLYHLSAAALAQALPRMAQLLAGWSPLGQPDLPAAQFAAWRPLLESESAAQGGVLGGADFGADPFARLVAELVLPPLRKELTNDWDPRDAASLERFVEAWEPLLPAAALHYIMQSLVLPRLRLAVQSWDPLRDTVALHTWVHPWLPYLGPQMAELWPVIRFKFTSALQAWHPSDGSAHAILAPWHKASVFDRRDWEQLLGRSIVPKLAFVLQELVINPAHQELEPLHWVLAWQDVMPLNQLALLFEQHFFPKWHAVLRHWLSNSPNYDEVTRWYLGWKSLFPQDLLDQERFRAQLSAALNAMNAAVGGAPPPSSWTAPRPAAAAGAAAAPAAAHAHHYDASDLTLRQLVEQYGEEAGVAFLPKPGRTHAGLQVYAFGLVSCTVDNAQSVVQAQMGADAATWATVSLEQLLAEHERRAAAKGAKGPRR